MIGESRRGLHFETTARLLLLFRADGKEFFELLGVVDERGEGRQFIQELGGDVQRPDGDRLQRRQN